MNWHHYCLYTCNIFNWYYFAPHTHINKPVSLTPSSLVTKFYWSLHSPLLLWADYFLSIDKGFNKTEMSQHFVWFFFFSVLPYFIIGKSLPFSICYICKFHIATFCPSLLTLKRVYLAYKSLIKTHSTIMSFFQYIANNFFLIYCYAYYFNLTGEVIPG